MSAFDRAVGAAGSQARLANILGVTNQAVSNWKRLGVPEDRCPSIEAVTGVRCEELRKDVRWTRGKTGQITGYHVPLRIDSAVARELDQLRPDIFGTPPTDHRQEVSDAA
ncbi:hypothetical protein P910_003449 [Xylella fastidiosa Mul-MD]|uniref:Cro/CI family transcriptional regulator n=1 Tax=Xylella fastidiosa TaxID=2371 RepID=UPI0003ED0A72|nr:Cro/CI family transcriptional regulator [Xylella fastidiosa]EWG13302.1 hypothetical protein P910_003449 [Xylella fastidiosa Mul-MD]